MLKSINNQRISAKLSKHSMSVCKKCQTTMFLADKTTLLQSVCARKAAQGKKVTLQPFSNTKVWILAGSTTALEWQRQYGNLDLCWTKCADDYNSFRMTDIVWELKTSVVLSVLCNVHKVNVKVKAFIHQFVTAWDRVTVIAACFAGRK